jgi:hypothetical protein
MTLPSASTRLSDQAGTAPVSTDLCAVFAACVDGADAVPVLYSNLEALIDAHGYCEGAEYAGLHMQGTRNPVLFVPLPIGTAGSMGRQDSSHTGTSKVSAAAGADGVLAEVDGIVKVTRGGTVGTDQIILSISLDDGTTYKPARLGTASSYIIPSIGVTLSFGAGTLVADDTILEFKTVAPIFDADGVTSALATMTAQQRQVRSWLFVGDVPTLALGQAIETAVNAYETSTERYCVAKFQARDRRIVESSGLQVAMVGSNSITFAEVGGTGDTITRATGSFVTDGFTVGDIIRVTGAVAASGQNNVTGKITNVAALVLTLDAADLEPEGPITTVAITGEPSFIFAAGTTITRNRGSWTAEGFAVGDTITVEGTASNDGDDYIITTLSATVITCVATTFVAETIGSATATISLTETEAAWMADIEADFDDISSSERVDIGAGRLTKLSPITGYTMRRPVQWADSIRSYTKDLSVPTWRKSDNTLDSWGIDGEHDERVNEGLLDGKFTCARTWANGPEGAFIAQSLTRAADGSILGMTHNMYVSSLVQTVVQRETENFVGTTLVLNDDGTATTASLRVLEAKVDAALLRNRAPNFAGENPRWSSARWTAATDDDLSVAEATLHGTCALNLNGTIVHVTTSVEVS